MACMVALLTLSQALLTRPIHAVITNAHKAYTESGLVQFVDSLVGHWVKFAVCLVH